MSWFVPGSGGTQHNYSDNFLCSHVTVCQRHSVPLVAAALCFLTGGCACCLVGVTSAVHRAYPVLSVAKKQHERSLNRMQNLKDQVTQLMR